MDAISDTVARANLAKTMEQFCNKHALVSECAAFILVDSTKSF